MYNLSALVFLILSITIINHCAALECYVCENQEDNTEKCVKTIKTCEYGEDACLTEIRWGSTPYWSQGALKQYYISKRCAKKEHCENYRESNMNLCTHIWYEDWKCSECCKGDRCNYYYISGAQNNFTAFTVLLVSFIVGILMNR